MENVEFEMRSADYKEFGARRWPRLSQRPGQQNSCGML
jgi:hypothetical protein